MVGWVYIYTLYIIQYPAVLNEGFSSKPVPLGELNKKSCGWRFTRFHDCLPFSPTHWWYIHFFCCCVCVWESCPVCCYFTGAHGPNDNKFSHFAHVRAMRVSKREKTRDRPSHKPKGLVSNQIYLFKMETKRILIKWTQKFITREFMYISVAIFFLFTSLMLPFCAG